MQEGRARASLTLFGICFVWFGFGLVIWGLVWLVIGWFLQMFPPFGLAGPAYFSFVPIPRGMVRLGPTISPREVPFWRKYPKNPEFGFEVGQGFVPQHLRVLIVLAWSVCNSSPPPNVHSCLLGILCTGQPYVLPSCASLTHGQF